MGVRHLEDGGRLSWLFGIKDVILRDVSFPDERDGAQQLVLRVAAGLYGITLIMVRLDADDVVRTLIPGNLRVEMSTSLMGSGMTMCVVTSRLT